MLTGFYEKRPYNDPELLNQVQAFDKDFLEIYIQYNIGTRKFNPNDKTWTLTTLDPDTLGVVINKQKVK